MNNHKEVWHSTQFTYLNPHDSYYRDVVRGFTPPKDYHVLWEILGVIGVIGAFVCMIVTYIVLH